MICQSIDSKSIYYEVVGNLESPITLLFLNGLSQSTQSWGLVIPFFRSSYKIVLMDFVFQGNSDKNSELRDFDQHALDVISVLNAADVDQAVVVGLSYGSLVAQHLAVNHANRINKLILLSTFAQKTPYYQAIELAWTRALESGGYDLLLDVMLPVVLSEQYFKNPLIPVELLKATRKEMVDSKALSKLMQATASRKDYLNELHKIMHPTLILHGRYDTLFPVHMGKQVSEHISNSSFCVIENAGHTLNLESVQEVSTTIKNFIES